MKIQFWARNDYPFGILGLSNLPLLDLQDTVVFVFRFLSLSVVLRPRTQTTDPFVRQLLKK